MQTVQDPPYLPRQFRSQPLWHVADFDLKVYTIDTGTPPAAELLDAARLCAEAALKSHAAARPHYRLGYCVLHAGTEANWLLVDWWCEGGIVCQRLYAAPAGTLEFSAAAPGLLACVWELVVIQHERNAWVRHMLTEQADRAAWLADQLPDGAY